jgi:hypothetical protein
MKQIQTHIGFKAPAFLVWAILADFGGYRRRNPSIRGILGRPETGAQIEVRLRSPRRDDVNVRSKIVQASEPRELRSLDRWMVPVMFSSERRFRIESPPEGGVRFHHGERANGIMARLFTRRRRLRTEFALDAMNTAPTQRAERAYAAAPAAAS